MFFNIISTDSLNPHLPENILYAMELAEAISKNPHRAPVLRDAFAEGEITILFVTDSATPNRWNPKTREIQINITGVELNCDGAQKIKVRDFIMHQIIGELCKAANPLLANKALPPILSYLNAEAYALEMAQREFVSFKMHSRIVASELIAAGLTPAAEIDFNTYWTYVFNATNGPAPKYRQIYTELINSYCQKLKISYEIITDTKINFTPLLPLDSRELMLQKTNNNSTQAILVLNLVTVCDNAIGLLIKLKAKACPEIQAMFAVNEHLELIQAEKKRALENYRMVFLGTQIDSAPLQAPTQVQHSAQVVGTDPNRFFGAVQPTYQPQMQQLLECAYLRKPTGSPQ